KHGRRIRQHEHEVAPGDDQADEQRLAVQPPTRGPDLRIGWEGGPPGVLDQSRIALGRLQFHRTPRSSRPPGSRASSLTMLLSPDACRASASTPANEGWNGAR